MLVGQEHELDNARSRLNKRPGK